MLCDPLLHLDRDPKAVNADGYDAQQEPFYPVAHQLAAVAVEGEATSIDDGMLCLPICHHADGEGSENAQREYDYKGTEY